LFQIPDFQIPDYCIPDFQIPDYFEIFGPSPLTLYHLPITPFAAIKKTPFHRSEKRFPIVPFVARICCQALQSGHCYKKD
jgi:hypothetical protein